LKNYLYLVLFFTIFTSAEVFAKNCQEVRMGLDIGSGSTKMMVAKVDFCANKILEVIHQESQPVPFNEDLEKSADGNLSQAIIDKGFATLSGMITKGKTFKPKRISGVATSVFRKSKNGVDVIKGYARKLKTRLEVVSQEEEAMLGYLSVLSLMDDKVKQDKNIVVWDIGGGSMQMFSMDKNKKPHQYLGDLASVTFKNMVIEVLQSKSLEQTTSPNPIGDKREQVIALARSYSKLHVPSDIKFDIKDRVVIGVGGVHSQSIKNQLQVKEPKYTLDEVNEAGKTQSLKSDKELTGDYRSTDVTNLLLVQGFMEGLGIKEVKIVNATLLQGVMLK
jgi:exopolyphosphatase/guanosine-5'-triphosphate,3'-diphosphate pyrophosphatase